MQANAFASMNTSVDTVSIALATAWVTADGQHFASNWRTAPKPPSGSANDPNCSRERWLFGAVDSSIQ